MKKKTEMRQNKKPESKIGVSRTLLVFGVPMVVINEILIVTKIFG